MAIQIIPAGSSAVVTDDDGRRGRGRGDKGRGPDRYDLSAQMRELQSPDRWDLSSQMRELQHPDRWDLSVQMRADAEAAALANCHSDNMSKDSFFAAQKQVSDAATSTVVGFKDAAATAYQLQGQSLLEAAKNAAAISVQNSKESDGLFGQAISNFNLSTTQATTNFNALTTQANLNQYNILLDSQKNAAAAILFATQVAASAAAQAAECCCELKEKITAEAVATRDLINSVNAQGLRDRAIRSENALSAYFAGKVPPTAPVI